MRVSSCTAVAIATATVLLSTTASRAGITGFNSLTGWQYNQGDSGTRADLPDVDTIQLTNLATAQRRSIFYRSPQALGPFTASFTYQALNASTFGCDYGAAFVIQSSQDGAAALGTSGAGMGYATIDHSIAITLELQNNASGYFTDGNIGGNGLPVGLLSLKSGHPFLVELEYDGNILHETITDTVTLESQPSSFVVGDLNSVIGASSAYVGFTASTTQGACSGNAADQYFSGFHFQAVPEPTTAALLLCGCVGALAEVRKARPAGAGGRTRTDNP